MTVFSSQAIPLRMANTKSAIKTYWISSALRTISFDEISEYTVNEKSVIKIEINMNAENLLK